MAASLASDTQPSAATAKASQSSHLPAEASDTHSSQSAPAAVQPINGGDASAEIVVDGKTCSMPTASEPRLPTEGYTTACDTCSVDVKANDALSDGYEACDMSVADKHGLPATLQPQLQGQLSQQIQVTLCSACAFDVSYNVHEPTGTLYVSLLHHVVYTILFIA